MSSSDGLYKSEPIPIALLNIRDYQGCFVFHAEDDLTLERSFVPQAWFDELCGQVSAIVFGDRGSGKTAHQIALNHKVQNHALVIILNDFDTLLVEWLTKGMVSATTYLNIIREKVLEAFKLALDHHPQRRQQFLRHSEGLKHWWAIQQCCHPPLNILALPELNAPDDRQLILTRYQHLGFQAWLTELSRLVRQVGFQSIYVLLDGVDNHSLTTSDPEAIKSLLTPLMNNLNVLRGCGFAFKFFLPLWFEQPMHQSYFGWLNELPIFHIQIDDRLLQKIISSKLKLRPMASQRNNQFMNELYRFADLCEVNLGFDVDQCLIHAAHQSPRKLIKLMQKIVNCHLHIWPEGNMLIDAQTIKLILGPYHDL